MNTVMAIWVPYKVDNSFISCASINFSCRPLVHGASFTHHLKGYEVKRVHTLPSTTFGNFIVHIKHWQRYA
jgi:hypothetical protein